MTVTGDLAAMEDLLTQAIRADPHDATAWLALADWLEEDGQADRAELLRLRECLRTCIDVPDRPTLEVRMRELLRGGTRPPVARWPVALDRDVTLLLALIPAGVFLMGSPPAEPSRFDNENPRHTVTISRPFYLGVYPVTQPQWRALMRHNPSTHPADDQPVETVNWHECSSFCARLSETLNRPCRLPFEAEWEYACRAGTTTTYHTGDGAEAMRLAGFCRPADQPRTSTGPRPVGQFLPNAFGLYDVHGNVREWCQDGQRPYSRRARVDPRGQQRSDDRVVRGGSWYYGPEDSRSASRYSRPTDYRLDYYGFRVVVECEESR
jgi:eukaryotic-like serine/threonine-protein kinase